MVAFENLLIAWRRACLGNRLRPPVARYALDLERELFTLQQALVQGTWSPGEYRLRAQTALHRRRTILRPHRVHHAVMNVIEPPLDRRFIGDTYACRRGRGVHAAVDRYQQSSRRYRYVLKMDVRKYFASIDRALLMDKLRARIKDTRVLELLGRIVEQAPSGDAPPGYFPGDDLFTPFSRQRGIPIGNLTSQFLANIYLDDFDHWMKETLRARACLRYVDDMVVLADDKAWLAEVRERLAAERLQLHPHKAHISPTSAGLNLLGYVVFPGFRRLRGDNQRRFTRKLAHWSRLYAEGRVDWCDFNPAVQSWIGHARHADTAGLRRHVFAMVSFQRGRTDEQPARVARRFLEQQSGEPACVEPQQEAYGQPQQQHRLASRPFYPQARSGSVHGRCRRGE